MNVFETELKKLKYEVLREVAILAKEDRINEKNLNAIPYKIIPGTKPTYRCCVYHERAILKERAKLAAGYISNGDDVEYSMEDDDDQILYVIEAACDTCPINKYTITEVCRGCIEHKCMEVCPANAITRINGKSYINQDLCRECGLCKKSCPYDAVSEVMRPCKKVCPTGALDIQYENRRAMIKEEDCINCGACMAACPFGAISDKSSIVPAIKSLSSDKKVYAVVAPAIAGQFGRDITVGQIKDALKKIGFYNMVEAACGADAVTFNETQEFIHRMENGDKYMTNSCCPGLVGYIENKFKDQVKNISHTVSPMIATAKLIKSKDKDAVVIFIGPCTAKKSEIKRKELKGIVNYVLTFEELAAIISAYKVDLEDCEDLEVNDASSFGRGFAQGGGLASAVGNIVKDLDTEIEFKPVKISGRENLKRYMILAKNGKLPGNFIEGMMCDGGCIGGPATICSQNKSKMSLNKFSKESKSINVVDNEKLKQFEELDLEI